MKLSGLEDTRGVRHTLSNTRDLTLMSLIHTSSRPFPWAHQSQWPPTWTTTLHGGLPLAA